MQSEKALLESIQSIREATEETRVTMAGVLARVESMEQQLSKMPCTRHDREIAEVSTRLDVMASSKRNGKVDQISKVALVIATMAMVLPLVLRLLSWRTQ